MIWRDSESLCNLCKHKIKGAMWCEAFEVSIPKEIWSNKFLHNKPFKGDNGIMFEPIDKSAKQKF